MALTRTTLIDDDGTGMTGSFWNVAQRNADWNVVDARWSTCIITTTGTVNNLNINDANGNDADYVIFAGTGDLVVNGINAPSPMKNGKPLRLINNGTGNVYFAHLSGAAVTTNRIYCPASMLTALTNNGFGQCSMTYDLSGGVWRFQTYQQGASLTPAYSAAAYSTLTGSGTAGTWTVSAGNRLRECYWQINRSIYWNFYYVNTTVTGTPQYLTIGLPYIIVGGCTAVSTADIAPVIATENGSIVSAQVQVIGASTLAFVKTIGNWATAAGATNIAGQFRFEIA